MMLCQKINHCYKPLFWQKSTIVTKYWHVLQKKGNKKHRTIFEEQRRQEKYALGKQPLRTAWWTTQARDAPNLSFSLALAATSLPASHKECCICCSRANGLHWAPNKSTMMQQKQWIHMQQFTHVSPRVFPMFRGMDGKTRLSFCPESNYGPQCRRIEDFQNTDHFITRWPCSSAPYATSQLKHGRLSKTCPRLNQNMICLKNRHGVARRGGSVTATSAGCFG